MLFVWEDGTTRDVPYGNGVVGLQQNGERPRFVVVTEAEMDKFVAPKDFSYLEYADKVTLSLCKDGKHLYIKDED